MSSNNRLAPKRGWSICREWWWPAIV